MIQSQFEAHLLGYKGGIAVVPGINPKTKKEWSAEELFQVAQTMCVKPRVRTEKKASYLWFDIRELKKLQLELENLGVEIHARLEAAVYDAGDWLGPVTGLSLLGGHLINMGIQMKIVATGS